LFETNNDDLKQTLNTEYTTASKQRQKQQTNNDDLNKRNFRDSNENKIILTGIEQLSCQINYL
jgi:hypothetical protein